eukprot:g525.t1
MTNIKQATRTPRLRPTISRQTSVALSETSGGRLSLTGATYTVVNTFVGLGLLSKPYAVMEGGLISIVYLAIICFVANYSGKIIIQCFKHPKASNADYPSLGKAAFGSKGLWAVRFFIILEFLGSCVTCLVLLMRNAYLIVRKIEWFGDMTEDNRPQYKLFLLLAILCCVTPTVWMLNFSDLWFLSLLGLICSCMVSLTVIACFVKAEVEEEATAFDDLSITGGSDDTMVCLGIYILSMAGHAALPGVYTQMREPEKFNTMLDWSFLAIFVVYAAVALAGYATFGSDAKVVVTDNLHDWPGGAAFYLTTCFVCLQIWSCISGCVQILCEIPEELLFSESNELSDDDVDGSKGYAALDDEDDDFRTTTIESPPTKESSRSRGLSLHSALASSSLSIEAKQRIFRTLVLWIVLGPLSFVCYGNLKLALCEAITGALCTMATSLIFPCAILCALFGIAASSSSTSLWTLSKVRWYGNAVVAVFGIFFGLYMTYGDLSKALG